MCLSLDKVLHAQLLTVKHGIGTEVYPLTQDEQAGLTREHKIQFDVTVTIDEIVDVGVRLLVFLGIEDKLKVAGYIERILDENGIDIIKNK